MLESFESRMILGLQLLIARAAQNDSLHWWEDDSLTPSGMYMLERLFFLNAVETARRLALEAARVRFQAAFGSDNHCLHLFHLDQTGEIAYDLQGICLGAIPVPGEPIQSIAELLGCLLEHAGAACEYQILGERPNYRLEFKLKNSPVKPGILDIVKTLAWAMLECEPGKPFFPYLAETV